MHEAIGAPTRRLSWSLGYNLTFLYYNNIVVSMIPALIAIPGTPWDVLPPGVHIATFAEVETIFAYNEPRRALLLGLIDASIALARCGCRCVFLDGSYVSGKPIPGDYDACWEPDGVDFDKLDPLFEDFDDGRANQKARFGGEFFPATLIEAGIGAAFKDFFQIDRFTGNKKGILSISLSSDETVLRRIQL
jgi:hypothetical protein